MTELLTEPLTALTALTEKPYAADGLTATAIASGVAEDGLHATLAGRVDAQLFHVVMEPGTRTQWHYHLGDVLGIITSGTLTRVLADGAVQVCPVGTSVVEPGGADNVHYGRNDGPGRLEFYAVYLAPVGAPLSIPVAPPCCAPDESLAGESL